MPNANLLAHSALLLFLPFAFLIFLYLRPTVATIVVLLVGDLFLPNRVAFDLPGVPALDKTVIPYVAVLLCLLARHPRLVLEGRPGRGLEWLAIAMALAGLGTVATNSDPLHYGPVSLPAIPLADWPTSALSVLLTFGVPFFLGRVLLRDTRDLSRLMVILVAAGLLYSLFVLVELRFSPQLHRWTYGFHPQAFVFSERYGGYRPHVYFQNGLALAMFLVVTIVAAAALARTGLRIFGIPAGIATAYLMIVLVLCKSIAAIFWGLCFGAAMLVLSARQITRLSVAVCLLVISFPLLRVADAFPWREIVSVAEQVDVDRAGSIEGRFHSEELMLEKVRERPIFGWGSYKRYWVFDPVSGASLTVPDGFWIIQLGIRGIVGFATAFGLYVIPVFVTWRRLDSVRRPRDRLLLAAFALILSVRALDQIPNGLWTTLPIFLAGGLSEVNRSLGRGGRRRRKRVAAGILDESEGGRSAGDVGTRAGQ